MGVLGGDFGGWSSVVSTLRNVDDTVALAKPASLISAGIIF